MKRTHTEKCAYRKRSALAAFLAAILAIAMLPLAAHAEQKDSLPGMGVQPAEYFYTGKPYDSDTGSYTFKYRNYDPELNRWTTTDPSGFPDGANNSIYTSQPLCMFDPDGKNLQPITMLPTFYVGDDPTQYYVAWNGAIKWSFDSQNERMKDNDLVETLYTGDKSGDGWSVSFHSANLSNTENRNDPSGKNCRDIISFEYYLAITCDGTDTFLAGGTFATWGEWYE